MSFSIRKKSATFIDLTHKWATKEKNTSTRNLIKKYMLRLLAKMETHRFICDISSVFH